MRAPKVPPIRPADGQPARISPKLRPSGQPPTRPYPPGVEHLAGAITVAAEQVSLLYRATAPGRLTVAIPEGAIKRLSRAEARKAIALLTLVARQRREHDPERKTPYDVVISAWSAHHVADARHATEDLTDVGIVMISTPMGTYVRLPRGWKLLARGAIQRIADLARGES